MLNDFTGADQVYIACGYTDLRKGIDGLARLVQQQFELDPFTNTLFLFCGRRRDRIKGLYWEKDGFILLYKRLEQGAYQWPRSESGVKTLTRQQYRWLMEGLQIEQPKAHRTECKAGSKACRPRTGTGAGHYQPDAAERVAVGAAEAVQKGAVWPFFRAGGADGHGAAEPDLQ